MGGTLFSSDPGPKGGSNLKALWRGHMTSARRPISYRICFMARRSFFDFYLFSTNGGQALSGKFHYFFFLNPSLITLIFLMIMNFFTSQKVRGHHSWEANGVSRTCRVIENRRHIFGESFDLITKLVKVMEAVMKDPTI